MTKNSEGPRNQESKERVGDSLLIARILRPLDQNDLFARIVGIPFEHEQLEGINISVDGRGDTLLDIMGALDLVGETKGVPHLSVGGVTTQMAGFVTYALQTSTLDSEATRAYLVADGLGVQGMGLVKYEGGKNNDFGLGMPFTRNSGAIDVGGGVDSMGAEFSASIAQDYWLSSAIYYGRPRFARILGTYPYQSWIKYDTSDHKMQKTSLIVREDGKRGVNRKRLTPAILDLMPWMCDSFSHPTASFETDGHNAFDRAGDLVFTDYEEHDAMFLNYDSFMLSLGRAWFFDECRKDFPATCKRFGFSQFDDLRNVDYPTIRAQVSEIIEEAHLRSDLKDPMVSDIEKDDRKAVERYAIAGLMASRALGRKTGQAIIKPFITNLVNDERYDSLTVQDVLGYVQSLPIENLPKQVCHTGEIARLSRNGEGKLCFEIDLKTFGLPVDSHITIPVAEYDIYSAWPYDQDNEQLTKMQLPKSLRDNQLADIEEDVIEKTIFSQLASAMGNMYGLEADGMIMGDSRRGDGFEYIGVRGGKAMKFRGYLPTLSELNAESALFLLEDYEDIEIYIDNANGRYSIEAKYGMQGMSLAQINKIAYAIHTYCMQQQGGRYKSQRLVTISGIV